MNPSTYGSDLPSRGGHRSLDEDVFQNSDEAVMSSPGEETSALYGYADSGSGVRQGANRYRTESGEQGFFSKMEETVTDYVATEPVKAGAIAVGVGGLLIVLLTSLLRRSRD